MNKTIFALAAAGAMFAPAQLAAQDYEADAAPDAARSGLRIEARATYETPTVSSVFEDGDVYKIGSAFAFGGEAGYDARLGDAWTFGPYVQYELSTVESCDSGFCLSAKDYLEAGASLGYMVGDAGLVYGKLGYGQLTLEASDGVDSASESNGGIAFGFGYEQGFGEMFYGRIEGGYADVGDFSGLNVQRRHLGVAVGARF